MLPLLARARFQILFHSPRRGSFRLSLAVLVRYRSPGRIQPWRMVPPCSGRIPRVPPYSLSPSRPFRVRGSHPVSPAFPGRSAWTMTAFGLVPVRSPLLGKSRLISFPRGTEMFHFPRLAPWSKPQGSAQGTGLPHSDIPGWYRPLPSPPGFSQACTSFIAAWRHGIHHARLFTWPHSPGGLRRPAAAMHSLDEASAPPHARNTTPENILQRLPACGALSKPFP